MNLGFQFRDQIGKVSSWLVEEFDALYAAIQTGWNVEHNADGTHGEVSATRLTAPQIGLSSAGAYLVPLDPIGVRVITVPRVSRVLIRTSGVEALNDLQGLVMTDVQEGDLLLLQVMGSQVLRIRRMPSATISIPLNSSFRWDESIGFSSYVLLDQSSAWAVYTRVIPGVNDVTDGSAFFWNLCGHFTNGA